MLEYKQSRVDLNFFLFWLKTLLEKKYILPRAQNKTYIGYTDNVTKGDMKNCNFTARFLNNWGDSWNDHEFDPQWDPF